MKHLPLRNWTFGVNSCFPRPRWAHPLVSGLKWWINLSDFYFLAWQEAAVKLVLEAVPSLPSGLSKQEVCFCFLLITNTSSIPNQHYVLDQIPVSSSTWFGSICFQYNLNWRTINKIGFRPQSSQNPGINAMCRLALQLQGREWRGGSFGGNKKLIFRVYHRKASANLYRTYCEGHQDQVLGGFG